MVNKRSDRKTDAHEHATDNSANPRTPASWRRGWKLAAIIVFGGFAVLIILTELVASILSAHGPYCASVDPTACQIPVTITNDTSSEVTIKECQGTGDKPCATFGEIVELSPGSTHQTSGLTERDPAQPWLVVDNHGGVKGCLNLLFTQDVPAPVTVRLSQLKKCDGYL